MTGSALYISVDVLASAEAQLDRSDVCLLRIRRQYGGVTGPRATGGYFQLKIRIPGIVGRLGIVSFAPETRRG